MSSLLSLIESIQIGHRPPALIMSEIDALFLINSLLSINLDSIESLYQYPDLGVSLYEKEEGKKELSVAIIRRIITDLSLTTTHPYPICIIRDIDQCSLSAMNALLKTLEEIPEGYIIIGTASSSESLLETIRSRAIIVSLNTSSHLLDDEYRMKIDQYISGDPTTLLVALFHEKKLSNEQALALMQYYFQQAKSSMS